MRTSKSNAHPVLILTSPETNTTLIKMTLPAFLSPLPLFPSYTRVSISHQRAKYYASSKQENPKGDMDIIERIYTTIFGPKQDSPFGLKRFDRDRFPELYPAPLDEFAAPVESDDSTVSTFRPLLARTQLEKRSLRLLYDANRDGWTAEQFHGKVNRQGACVVLCSLEDDSAIFGGYNPKGWVGYGESRGSKAAFLFSWPDGDLEKAAMKMRKVGGNYLAVMDEPEKGPMFGADGLVVPLKGDRRVWSKLGSYYEKRPDGARSLFEGKVGVLKELRVWGGVYEEGEEIPFNDALPFSLE